MGTTLREVIFEIGGGIKNGKKFKAVQTGGPSGGCLTEKHLDTPIDYDNLLASGSMMGSGGMIVMDEDDCMVSVAKFYLEFTVDDRAASARPAASETNACWRFSTGSPGDWAGTKTSTNCRTSPA